MNPVRFAYNVVKRCLDLTNQGTVAISVTLVAKCQGCVEGHIKSTLKVGATMRGISETMAIAMGVSAAAVVERAGITAANLHLKHF